MAADIQFAPEGKLPDGVSRISVHLQADGYYWWLYWYFEAASLPPRNAELIDLYDYSEISGYQLELLRRELVEARFDATQRPDEWRVVIGWEGGQVSAEAERVSIVRKTEMLKVIDDLLFLVTTGLEHNVPVECIGD
jgi:hypothetical protein